MTDAPLSPPAEGLSDVRRRLREAVDLSPQARRAADWILAHPEEVALLSMRRQAEAAGVPPATMTRLAQTLGWSGFEALRAPFLAWMRGEAAPFSDGARAAQERPVVGDPMIAAEIQALAALGGPVTEAAVDAAARRMLAADRVVVVGARSSATVAHALHYGYGLMRDNGRLMEGTGTSALDALRGLGPGDLLVAIGQRPYASPTVAAAAHARSAGAEIIAIADSLQAPIARDAAVVLLAPPGGSDFFPALGPMLTLAQMLLSRLAALGGPEALARIRAAEAELAALDAFWRDPSPNRTKSP